MTETSKEYGTALFMLARENGTENEYSSALDTVLNSFNENPEFMDFLCSPRIPKKERLAVIEETFKDALPEHVVSFVQLLCERGRIRNLTSCIKEYKELLDSLNRVSLAKVTSSVELTDAEKQKLVSKLEKISGHSVMLDCSVDKSLIGGLVVEMDGKLMDGSIRHRLHEVKEVISR